MKIFYLTLFFTSLVFSQQGVGIGTNSPSQEFELETSQDGDTTLRIENVNAGTSSRTRLELANDASTGSGGIQVAGSGYTDVSGWQDTLIMRSDSGLSGGIIINPQTKG